MNVEREGRVRANKGMDIELVSLGVRYLQQSGVEEEPEWTKIGDSM